MPGSGRRFHKHGKVSGDHQTGKGEAGKPHTHTHKDHKGTGKGAVAGGAVGGAVGGGVAKK